MMAVTRLEHAPVRRDSEPVARGMSAMATAVQIVVILSIPTVIALAAILVAFIAGRGEDDSAEG